MTRPIELWAKEDRHAAGERDEWRLATTADIAAKLAAMPTEEREAVLDAYWDATRCYPSTPVHSQLAASLARVERLEKQLDSEAKRAKALETAERLAWSAQARADSKMLVSMCDEAKKRVVELEQERDDAKKLAERLNQEVCRGPGVRPCGLLVDETIRMKQSIEKAERELEMARTRLGAVPAEDAFDAARRVVAERDDLRSKLQKAELAVEQRDSIIRAQDAEIGRLREQIAQVVAESDSAMKKAQQEYDHSWSRVRLEIGDLENSLRVAKERERDAVRERDEAIARSSKLEAALGQAEKERDEAIKAKKVAEDMVNSARIGLEEVLKEALATAAPIAKEDK